MAKMNLSNPIDEGYPESRCVDGINVKECAANEGAFRHFGTVTKMRRQWTNSKTGKPVKKPDYADDYPVPGRGY